MDNRNGTIAHFSSIPAQYQAPICKTRLRANAIDRMFIVHRWDAVTCKKCLAKQPTK
jgi:hypothetical protein